MNFPTLSRRTFLAQLCATSALSALSSRTRAEGAFNLGFSLYGMKTVPLPDALKTCAEIGYRNVEFALGAGYATEPKILDAAARKNLRESLAEHKLAVSALMDNMSLADDKGQPGYLERIKAAAQLAHDLAPDNPPILETVLGGKSADWEKLKERMAANARAWGETAAANKLTLCLKPHVGSAVTTPERLLWLHGQVANPAVKLCYDYSHFQLAGLTLDESIKPLISETRFIHVKDAIGDATKFQFALPGEGKIDYTHYAELLKQFNYTGPVVVEVSAQVFNKPGYDPVAAAKKSYAALSAFHA